MSTEEVATYREIINTTHVMDYDTLKCEKCGATTNVVLCLCEDCFAWNLSITAKTQNQDSIAKLASKFDDDEMLWILNDTNEYFRYEVNYSVWRVGPPPRTLDNPEIWSLSDPIFRLEQGDSNSW